MLWSATLVRSASLWLELVARPLLILELTGSAFLPGVAVAAWMAPNLILAPFVGIIIDRYPYRHVLVGSFAANVTSAAVLFLLLLLDRAEAWHVILLATVSGTSTGDFNPARRAIVPVTVEQPLRRAATALAQTAQTSMRVGGALAVGLLLRFADFTWIFGLMIVLGLSAALLVAQIRSRQKPHEPNRDAGGSVLRRISAGATWTVETRWPLVVLFSASALFIFLQRYERVMVPLILIEELGQHQSWVEHLTVIGGVGSTLGWVPLASTGQIRSPNALVIGILATGGAMLLLLSQAPHLAVAAICVFFGSACVNNMTAVANLALLAHALERPRGQALTLMNLVIGTSLIGALLAGSLGDSLGPARDCLRWPAVYSASRSRRSRPRACAGGSGDGEPTRMSLGMSGSGRQTPTTSRRPSRPAPRAQGPPRHSPITGETSNANRGLPPPGRRQRQTARRARGGDGSGGVTNHLPSG